MNKRSWGLIIFLVLMLLMLAGGLALFIHAAMQPQVSPPWKALLPLHV